ncbi:GvpL/GvpF family gas vesicle protein [Thermomonospora catenispora]|uniref:GvpL/GvpF family gas vesicle protein n=1 Tax=Thermomonospora catenispora TaxID=2493090 RepID=UPI00111DB5BE|nr:GvpL/GvpF family gas vesicle protein [Thermomonospora catenispora]TNY38180.1 GvpL/GvpF family gas vesicle protein [Thermomonospora catenispora]
MTTDQRETGRTDSAWYVYGIVPADVETAADVRGVDGRRVQVVRHGDVAALVSEIDPGTRLGRPDDLLAHQRLLDDAAVDAPVLPLRFGAVMTTAQAVAEDLLAPNRQGFAEALANLEGRVEYVLKGRFDERTVLGEVVRENAEAARLRERIHGRPETETHRDRVRLGELIHREIEARRRAVTERLVRELSPCCVASAVRDPTHHLDAVHVALLVEDARRPELEEAAATAVRAWADRVELRLLGPLAPWDFVVTPG